MFKVDELRVCEGEFVCRLFDLSDESDSNDYEFHIEDVTHDDITAFSERHMLYPVLFAQFHALKKAYRECDAANSGEGDVDNLEYWEDMVCGLERSFKAIFHAYRGAESYIKEV